LRVVGNFLTAIHLRSVCLYCGLALRLALVFFSCDLFFSDHGIFGRGTSFLIVCGHAFPNVGRLIDTFAARREQLIVAVLPLASRSAPMGYRFVDRGFVHAIARVREAGRRAADAPCNIEAFHVHAS
jgi:hypothetical protein